MIKLLIYQISSTILLNYEPSVHMVERDITIIFLSFCLGFEMADFSPINGYCLEVTSVSIFGITMG